jgi:Ca2+-binding RTX toxin-like protein
MTIYLGGNRVVTPLTVQYGHLQIIYQGWELEVQAGSTWRFRHRTVDGQTNGRDHTPGYGDPNHYEQTAIDLGDRSAADTWHLLLNAHRQYSNQFGDSIRYLGVTQNSNSYVATLMSIIGVDVGAYLGLISLPGIPVEPDPFSGIEPYIAPFGGYPGSGMNVLERYGPDFTLNGRASNDIIRTGSGNDSISGNGGNDEIDGGSGADTLSGGAGNDTLSGGDGNDLLFGGNSADFLQGGGDADTIHGEAGHDTLSGDDGNDLLFGGDGADFLFGGGGADTIYGGAGRDTIWFDELDVIDGGLGRDTAYLSSRPYSASEQAISVLPIQFDMQATSVEILVLPAAFTGAGGHRITGIGANHMVAAGGGDDHLVIDRSNGGGPAIVWGGAGDDTFEFMLPEGRTRPLGLMFVDVPNLTERNFAAFHRGLIEGTSGLSWGQIDAIILNPEQGDRVISSPGFAIGTSVHSSDVTQFYYAREGNSIVPSSKIVASFSYLSGNPDPDVMGGMAGDYDVSFLGGGNRTVFAAAAQPHFVSFMKFADPDIDDYYSPHWWEGVLSTGSAIRGEDSVGVDWVMEEYYFTNIGYALAFPNGFGQGPAGPVVSHESGEYWLGVPSINSIGTFTTNETIGDWFVLGGRFEGTDLVSDGSFTAATPPESMFL